MRMQRCEIYTFLQLTAFWVRLEFDLRWLLQVWQWEWSDHCQLVWRRWMGTLQWSDHCKCGSVSVAMWVIRPLSIYNACLSRSRMGTETLLYVALLLLLIFSNSFIYLLLKYSHGWLRHECLGCARQNSIRFFFIFLILFFQILIYEVHHYLLTHNNACSYFISLWICVSFMSWFF